MALSKKDLVINITLNELYNTHSLILQHIEVLVNLYPSFSSSFTVLLKCLDSRQMISSICVF